MGLIVSNVGGWMSTVAQGWLVLGLTNRPLYLGLVALAFAVPMTFLPPFGGAISDRVDKLMLMRATLAVQMAAMLLLAGLTLGGVVRVWHIIGLGFVAAVAGAAANPNRQALLPSLVPREDLMSAISLNSVVYTGAALVGPALGGVLLGAVGPGGLFLVDGLTYAPVLLATLFIRGVDTAPRADLSAGLLADVAEGLRRVGASRVLLGLVGVSALAGVLGRSYSALLPVFARDVWRVGERGYGLLLGGPGAGALLGAFGLAAYGEVRRKGRLLLGSMLALGLVLLGFSWSPAFWPALGLLVVAGALTSVLGASIATLIQLRAPEEMRARALSLYTVTVIGVPSLGAMGVASAAERLGARLSVGLPACLLIALAVLLLARPGDLRDAG